MRRVALLGFMRTGENEVVELWAVEDQCAGYATWMYNELTKGYHLGRYFVDASEAREDFWDRAYGRFHATNS